jgi:hypothetical protein
MPAKCGTICLDKLYHYQESHSERDAGSQILQMYQLQQYCREFFGLPLPISFCDSSQKYVQSLDDVGTIGYRSTITFINNSSRWRVSSRVKNTARRLEVGTKHRLAYRRSTWCVGLTVRCGRLGSSVVEGVDYHR